MTIRNDVGYEAGAEVRFGLAYERLRAEDEATRKWLDRHCFGPDEDESDEGDRDGKGRFTVHSFPGLKVDGPPGFCQARGCNRKIRARGLCERCYRNARRAGLLESYSPQPRACVCGCGRMVNIKDSRVGPLPKYATDACRRKVWDRNKPVDHRSYTKEAL